MPHVPQVCSFCFGDELTSENARVAVQDVQLSPRDFFVAFGGVICLTFDGFPIALEEFKARLHESKIELPPEALGSKWAKSTLGALKEWPSSKDDQLKVVECIHQEALLFREELRAAGRAKVTSLQVVSFKDRALINRHLVAEFNFTALDPVESFSQLSPEMVARTDAVLGDFFSDDQSAYKTYVESGVLGKPVTEAHYVSPVEGTTMVIPLFAGDTNKQVWDIVTRFQQKVDDRLKGLAEVQWFSREVLHSTIRGL